MATKHGTLLSAIAECPAPIVSRLAELWLTTAEELVSAGSQPHGRESLATFLGVPLQEVDGLVSAAEAVVPAVSFSEEVMPVSFGALPVRDVASPDDEPVSFAELPPQIDLRDRMPPVRLQGGRGTCVAHATSAVREFLLDDERSGADLSEQFIYWACKQRDGFAGPGTWIETGMAVLKDIGTCPEARWPYNGEPVAGNEGQGPPPAEAEREAARFRVMTVTKINATWVTALREALAAGLPVAFSVHVFDSCRRPHAFRVGDLRLPLPGEQDLGGHAMCMVGYVDDADTPGGGYFIVRNSWGTAFAQEGHVAPGYCRLPYEYVRQHGLEAFSASTA